MGCVCLGSFVKFDSMGKHHVDKGSVLLGTPAHLRQISALKWEMPGNPKSTHIHGSQTKNHMGKIVLESGATEDD